MDLGLALHAGGDLSCGVESFVEFGGLDGLEGGRAFIGSTKLRTTPSSKTLHHHTTDLHSCITTTIIGPH